MLLSISELSPIVPERVATIAFGKFLIFLLREEIAEKIWEESTSSGELTWWQCVSMLKIGQVVNELTYVAAICSMTDKLTDAMVCTSLIPRWSINLLKWLHANLAQM